MRRNRKSWVEMVEIAGDPRRIASIAMFSFLIATAGFFNTFDLSSGKISITRGPCKGGFCNPNFEQGIQNSCSSSSTTFVTTGLETHIVTNTTGIVEYDFGIGTTSLTAAVQVTLGVYLVEQVANPSVTCNGALPAGSFSIDGVGNTATPPLSGGYTWIGHPQFVSILPGLGRSVWIFLVMKTSNTLDSVNVNDGYLIIQELE